jgi:hypothetical protein
MFSWWILHDCSLEVVLIIFRVKNEVHLSTKGTYSTIFYTLRSAQQRHAILNQSLIDTPSIRKKVSLDFQFAKLSSVLVQQ